MNLQTYFKNINAYGTTEGLQKAWENRPRALPRPQLTQARYLSLELTNHSYPTLFNNDDKTSWHWSSDKKNLIVEVTDEVPEHSPLGFGVRTTYTIPVEKISYWGPEHNSPAYTKRLGTTPEYGYGPGFMMGMRGKKKKAA